MNDRELFSVMVQIGARASDLPVSWDKDACDFSAGKFSGISENFLTCFSGKISPDTESCGLSLFRYLFLKGMENRVGSDLFSFTLRGDVFRIFHSPAGTRSDVVPTNLPKFLELAVNEYQEHAQKISDALIRACEALSCPVLTQSVLNAVQYLGWTAGAAVSKEYETYKGYSVSEMLTRCELNELAGHILCGWLQKNGLEISGKDFSGNAVRHITAGKNGELYYITLAAEIAPEEPVLYTDALDALYADAEQDQAVPCTAGVILCSADEKHSEDGVILAGDGLRYRVSAFEQLELNT